MRQLKDKTVQRAIVLLYLRMRRTRHRYNRAMKKYKPNSIHARFGDIARAEYTEAHNALESMKNVLWHGEYPHIGREYRFLGREWPNNQQASFGAGRTDAA